MVADDPNDGRTHSFSALTAGTTVSHYRIVTRIGAGGMGEVYLAVDTELNRKVALKFLPQHLCQVEELRKRFKREAQAAASLDHPNIAGIYEVGEYGGRPFYSMQFVEGHSLREAIAGKDLPIERILELAIQICEGLQAAHGKRIIHRDIKPSNILLDSQDRARIVDFGLASMLGSEHLTKTGSTLGTVGYMSPEQVKGEAIDCRSDLFSLGVVLYEMITGQNPFKRDSEAATMKAVCDDTPHPVTRYRSDVPDGLKAIIDKSLEKDVRTRYQHADEMLSDLRRQLRDSSATDRELHRQPISFRISLPIVASVIVAIAVLAIIATQDLFRNGDASKVVPVSRKVTSFGDVEMCDLSPDGSYFAYSRVTKDRSYVVMIDDIKGGSPLKVLESQRISCLEWSSDGKELLVGAGDDSSMTAYVMSRFGKILRHYVVPVAPESRTLQWHPDGTKFLFMTPDSNLISIDRQSGDTAAIKLPVVFARLLDRSPASDLMLMVWHTDERGVFLCTARPDGSGFQKLVESLYGQAVFSAEGDAVYYAEWAGIVCRLMRLPINPKTGEPAGEPEVLIPNLARVTSLSISADGRRLMMRQRIASSNLHKVLLTPGSSQKTVETEALTFGTGFHSWPSISPDGQQIAFADFTEDSFQVFVMPVTGGERRQLTYSGFGNFVGDWSPDSKKMAYFRMVDIAVKDLMLCVTDIASGTSRDIVKYSIMGCTSGFELDWAPCGTILTKAPYCAGIWLVDPESGNTTTLPLAESDVAIRDLHYSPDSSQVAFHWDQDGQEFDGIWTKSLADGRQQFIARADARIIGWSPDGEWIYFHQMERDGLLSIARVHAESAETQSLAVLRCDVPSSDRWIDLAPDASWAVIEKEMSQTDVWLVDNFDPHAK